MSKKTLIIIGGVLIIILLALVGYFLFFQKSSDGTDSALKKFTNFFPFGGGDEVSTPAPEIDFPTDPVKQKITDYTKKLRKISSEPVAGAGIVDFKAGSVIRHIERATGHIFETEMFSPVQNRISNTTLPLAYNASWGNSNGSLIAQYLSNNDKTIDTYILTLKTIATTTQTTVTALQLTNNVTEYSTLANSIFYIERVGQTSNGIVADWSGGKKKQVWTSPLSEVLPQYVNAGTVAITTKPNKDIAGYLYFINTTTGISKKILGNINGLSTLVSPDATTVLFSSSSNTRNAFIYSVTNKTYTDITPYTYPEKCVWSKKDKNTVYCAVPTGSLASGDMDNWYLGTVSFSDSLWKYDLKNKTSALIEDLREDSGEDIDVIKPILNDSEQYLVFINKRDNSLWSFDLK